jgi:hypothetical protein
MKIIITFLITFLILFGISFFLDLNIIKSNWMRYGLIILLALSVGCFGFKIIIEQLKKLKNNITEQSTKV